jgi:hypothetical protein
MTREIEPELLQRLGLFMVRFAHLENCLSNLFVKMTGGEPGLMIVVTANVSQTSISDWIRTILEIAHSPHEWANEIRSILDDLDELRAERNTLVHGLWTTDSAAGSVVVQTVRLDRREIIKGRVLTAADLGILIEEALSIYKRLTRVTAALHAGGPSPVS